MLHASVFELKKELIPNFNVWLFVSYFNRIKNSSFYDEFSYYFDSYLSFNNFVANYTIMNQPTIQPELFQFLNELAENNERPWFNEHKPRFQELDKHMKAFGKALEAEMNKHDMVEPVKLYRIYRDVRFSKNKVPYKTNRGGSFTRATKFRRGGYYFHLEPGNSFVAGGFWGPNKEDLKRIRVEIAADAQSLREIIAQPIFIQTFGELKGAQLKTAPRDYPKDHPDIDLLRYKQYLLIRNFTDKEVLAKDFLQKLNQSFANMRPFLDYMSDVLTTDENGVPIQ